MNDRPLFFETPDQFRDWLEKNHDSATELWVGFHKKGTGRAGITWPEAVEQALCFGWIDGVRRSVDEHSYANRFTPRRPTSNWSSINIDKVAELERRGLMTPAGRAAFERRKKEESGIDPALAPEYEKRLRANSKAWEWFRAQPPWYRRTAIRWVVSAKREETRERRVAALIEDSAAGRTIKPLTRPKKGAA
jgi:uncharacterized protein YdeI (YjbR/CyaY-like superfamily)